MFWIHLCSKIKLLLNYWSITKVFMWSLRRGDFNIPLSKTHYCLKIDRKNTINHLSNYPGFNTLGCLGRFNIDLKTHIFLPTGGNFMFFCKLNEGTNMSLIRCAYCLEVKWLEWYCFGVSQELMSLLFVMFKIFWMVFWEHKMELVWKIDETEVIGNLIEDNVWSTEDERTGS